MTQHRFEGNNEGKDIVVFVDDDRITWKGPEDHHVFDSDALTRCSVLIQRRGAVVVTGLIAFGIGAVWLQTPGQETIGAVVAAVGAGLGVWGFIDPVHRLVLATEDQTLSMRVAKGSREAAAEAAEMLRTRHPEIPMERALLGAIGFQFKTLTASREALAKDYQDAFEYGTNDAEEARYITARKRAASWLVGWSVLFPTVLTALSAAVVFQGFEPSPGAWVVRTGAMILVFGAWAMVGLVLQGKLLPRARGWLEVSRPRG